MKYYVGDMLYCPTTFLTTFFLSENWNYLEVDIYDFSPVNLALKSSVLNVLSEIRKERELLKTCDTRNWNLLKNLKKRRKYNAKHLSIGRAPTGRAHPRRAPRRRAPNQESATKRVPVVTWNSEWINFPFPANTPVSTVLVSWSQLGHPRSSGGISPVIGGSSPCKVSSPTPTCNKTVPSESRLAVHYKKKSLSATGSSKTLQNLCQVYNYSEVSTVNYPYKTPLQKYFEHCLGTAVLLLLQGVCDSPPSKPGSLDARSPTASLHWLLNPIYHTTPEVSWI